MSILSFIFVQLALASPVTIVVIDTGYAPKHVSVPICQHVKSYDATTNHIFTDKTLYNSDDEFRHGTKMTHIIRDLAEKTSADYCFVIVKYYLYNQTPNERLLSMRRAIRYLVDKKIDVISYSSSGTTNDRIERDDFIKLLNKGVMINVSSGNDNIEMGKDVDVFPAMYDKRINVIGSYNFPYANTGKPVDFLENGVNVCTKDEECSNGTSPATAIFTGKQIQKLYEKKNNR